VQFAIFERICSDGESSCCHFDFAAYSILHFLCVIPRKIGRDLSRGAGPNFVVVFSFTQSFAARYGRFYECRQRTNESLHLLRVRRDLWRRA
jgi:hypothetical protein